MTMAYRIGCGFLLLWLVLTVSVVQPHGVHIPGEIHVFDRLTSLPGLTEEYWWMMDVCEGRKPAVWHHVHCGGWRG